MLYISSISSILGLSQQGDIDEGPQMSKMGDLFITLSDQLSKESKAFQAANDCGCNSCEDYTTTQVQLAFEKMSKANNYYVSLGK